MALPHDTFTYKAAKFEARLRTQMIQRIFLNAGAGILFVLALAFFVFGIYLFSLSVRDDSARALALALVSFVVCAFFFAAFVSCMNTEERVAAERAKTQAELDAFIAEAEGPREPQTDSPTEPMPEV